VARRAQLLPAEGAPVVAAAPITDAWPAVARAAGIDGQELARRVAGHYRLGVADLNAAEPKALKLLPEKVVRQYLVFPLRETDRQLVVATSNPTNLDAEQALSFASGRTAVLEVAPPASIQRAIDAQYAPDSVVETLLDRVGAETQDLRFVEETGPEAVAAEAVEAAPVTTIQFKGAIHR